MLAFRINPIMPIQPVLNTAARPNTQVKSSKREKSEINFRDVLERELNKVKR